MPLAPVLLIAYNRPDHTRKTLEALRQNALASESNLFVYVDGPKEDASEVRKILGRLIK